MPALEAPFRTVSNRTNQKQGQQVCKYASMQAFEPKQTDLQVCKSASLQASDNGLQVCKSASLQASDNDLGDEGQCILDSNWMVEKFIHFITNKEIDGYRLKFSEKRNKMMLIKNGNEEILDDIVWPNMCNTVVKRFDFYCTNKDPNAEIKENDKYKRMTISKARAVAKRIKNLYHDKTLENHTDEIKDKLFSLGIKLNVDVREWGIVGSVFQRIIGGNSDESLAIAKNLGWTRKRVERGSVWIHSNYPFQGDYKNHMITEENIKNPRNFNKYKKGSKDERYTMYECAKNEISVYTGHWQGQKVYCPCDHYRKSNISGVFIENFKSLGLKELITSCMDGVGSRTTLVDDEVVTKIFSMNSGDCFGSEALDLLRECDIVVTNPPFSRSSEFAELLITHNKKHLIMAPLNSICSQKQIELIKDDRIWLGKTMRDPKTSFETPDGDYTDVGLVRWYTNLTYQPEDHPLELTCDYDPAKYKKIDGHNAINVRRLKDIPKGYYKKMGVPITFLDYYNDKDYELLGVLDNPTVDGEAIYKRLIIKRR